MFISVHIPKTAGTSFFQDLKLIFGKDLCCDYSDAYKLVDPFCPSPLQRAYRLRTKLFHHCRHRQSLRESDRCIHGHFNSQKYGNMFDNLKLMTWFRDPVQRVASHYYHWLRNPDYGHSVCRILLLEKLSLLDFSRIDAMRNLQSRYFDQSQFNQLWFCGITETYETSIKSLYSKFQLERPIVLESANTNPSKEIEANYNLSTSEISEIRNLNLRDQELYDRAQSFHLK